MSDIKVGDTIVATDSIIVAYGWLKGPSRGDVLSVDYVGSGIIGVNLDNEKRWAPTERVVRAPFRIGQEVQVKKSHRMTNSSPETHLVEGYRLGYDDSLTVVSRKPGSMTHTVYGPSELELVDDTADTSQDSQFIQDLRDWSNKTYTTHQMEQFLSDHGIETPRNTYTVSVDLPVTIEVTVEAESPDSATNKVSRMFTASTLCNIDEAIGRLDDTFSADSSIGNIGIGTTEEE